MKIKVTEIDAILSRTDLQGIKVLAPILSYKTTIWKQGQFAKRKLEVIKKCYKTHGTKEALFPTGFIPKIKLYLESVGYKFELINLNPIEIGIKDQYVLKEKVGEGKIKFRPDQIKLMDEAFKNKRGLIKSPTGSGKSILMMGITSKFMKEENILILCHNASIVKQLHNDFTKYFSRVTMFGGDIDPQLKFEPLKHRIVLSTIQSFSKIHPNNYCDYFSCVMVDEAHRVSSFTGLYADVLQNILAPYRFGFTATLPTTPEAQFAYEGFIGPMIAELSINEAAELNILAKPKLKIIKAGFPASLRDIRDYHSVYEEGIVQNETRNQQIVAIIQECVNRDETVLIFVNKIAQGENIAEICFQQGVSITFVQGSSDIETRERVRNELNLGSIRAVISTTVWKEGINIPNLHNIINAAGGKSEIATLQAIGRGLRKTSGKYMVRIYDFFDPGHPYLIAHFGERLCLYMDMGWL
jgi:superfamily II DNA or RNA helicase